MQEEQQLAIQQRLDRESSFKERDTESISHKTNIIKKLSGGINKHGSAGTTFLEV